MKGISIPVLHMIREVVRVVHKTFPNCKGIGLLATTGTVSSDLYQATFQAQNISMVQMTSGFQDNVMAGVRAVKGGRQEEGRKILLEAGRQLVENGAEGLVLGCTYIPIAISARDFQVPVFDSNNILAEATVSFAMNR